MLGIKEIGYQISKKFGIKEMLVSKVDLENLREKEFKGEKGVKGVRGEESFLKKGFSQGEKRKLLWEEACNVLTGLRTKGREWKTISVKEKLSQGETPT